MEFETMEGALNMYSVTAKTIEEKQAEFSRLRNEFEEQNKELTNSIVSLYDDISAAKSWIKIEAEKEFERTGQKKLLGGIGIRVSNVMDYSTEDAIVWAKENMPVAVKEVIDKKQFESFAKENDLDFVEKEKRISVTFPKEIII